jgi:hypothetical protein
VRKQILAAAVLTGCSWAPIAFAVEVGADTTVGGRVYFDVSHISLQNENASGLSSDVPPTGTGFDVKRFYLIVDHKFNDIWSANLTTDAQFSTAATAQAATPSGGTTTVLTNGNTSGGVSEVYIKKLYVQGKFDDSFVLRVGATDLPWIPYLESFYGYRYVEKLALDRLGLGTTSDWGLNINGKSGVFDYSASVVNGGGYKNPTRTKDVDFEGRIGVKPIEWLILAAGVYSGHLGQINASNSSFPSNTATRFDFVAAVNYEGWRLGAEYLNAKNFKTVNNLAASVYGASAIVTSSGAVPVSDKADGVSGWASYSFAAQWSVFGRYDQVKLSKDVAPSLKDTYFNLGMSYKPIKGLDFALVYKNEKVDNGSASLSGGNAGGSYTIGGANSQRSGKFNEIGLYAQWTF